MGTSMRLSVAGTLLLWTLFGLGPSASAAEAATQRTYLDRCASLVQQPRTWGPECDETVVFSQLRWRDWGRARAVSSGRARRCAGCKTTRASLVAYRPRRCGLSGGYGGLRKYTRVRMQFAGKTFVQQITCLPVQSGT